MAQAPQERREVRVARLMVLQRVLTVVMVLIDWVLAPALALVLALVLAGRGEVYPRALCTPLMRRARSPSQQPWI